MLDGNSSFCAYQNLLSTCYTESVNVFLSYSTYWNGTYTENNVVKPIPETSFNKSEPRQLTAIVGNETGAQCRPITTTTTARATATATATLRPASAAGLRAGAQWALGVGAAVLAVWA